MIAFRSIKSGITNGSPAYTSIVDDSNFPLLATSSIIGSGTYPSFELSISLGETFGCSSLVFCFSSESDIGVLAVVSTVSISSDFPFDCSNFGLCPDSSPKTVTDEPICAHIINNMVK